MEEKKDTKELTKRSFVHGDPQTATERDLKARWGGDKPGKRFRCHLCGYKFTLGDYWRCQYTNSHSDSYAHGNPFVCRTCDTSKEEVIEKWIMARKEADQRFWWLADVQES